MRLNADGLSRLAIALTDLADISDRTKVHVSDSYGQAYVELDGELVQIRTEPRDDGTRTYYVEFQGGSL